MEKGKIADAKHSLCGLMVIPARPPAWSFGYYTDEKLRVVIPEWA